MYCNTCDTAANARATHVRTHAGHANNADDLVVQETLTLSPSCETSSKPRNAQVLGFESRLVQSIERLTAAASSKASSAAAAPVPVATG